MCGIAGILAFDEQSKERMDKIRPAVHSLNKRGPDGEGFYFHNNVALGHRRLSIIDTSTAGAQPFTDSTGRFTIVFNGELFNFKELKEQLINKGYHFTSQSDTEVLLYMFISEKEHCLKQLNGEFSFAVFDNITEELFIARDRFGIKPLYYYIDEHYFAFASELKALMQLDVPKNIDQASLQTYLHLNYIPAPYSIFENVLKLGAASYFKINKSGIAEQNTYYQIPLSGSHSGHNTTYEQAQKQLRQLLEQSVIQRMEADVPLGSFLSGGIDSSIITAIAAQHSKHLNTFSIGYANEPLFDETHYAELVAKKYNTNHTVFKLSNNDLFEKLFDVLNYTDEPFADSSALAVSILCEHTKKHVTVALSGDGADEIFGGYNKHAAEMQARQKGLKSSLVQAVHPLVKLLPKSRNSKTGNIIRQLDKFAEGIKLNDKDRYWLWAGFSNDNSTHQLLINTNQQEYTKRKEALLKNIGPSFDSVLYTDMQLVLENDMLVKVDRMSMSRSLEVRVPFLDHHLVDFAFALPTHYKIDNKHRKKILKDTFRHMLPEELYQRGKQGFEVPLLKWFNTDLKPLITELLDEEFIKEQQLFNPDAINKLKQQLFSSNPNDAVARIWALIVFQYWWKKYIA